MQVSKCTDYCSQALSTMSSLPSYFCEESKVGEITSKITVCSFFNWGLFYVAFIGILGAVNTLIDGMEVGWCCCIPEVQVNDNNTISNIARNTSTIDNTPTPSDTDTIIEARNTIIQPRDTVIDPNDLKSGYYEQSRRTHRKPYSEQISSNEHDSVQETARNSRETLYTVQNSKHEAIRDSDTGQNSGYDNGQETDRATDNIEPQKTRLARDKYANKDRKTRDADREGQPMSKFNKRGRNYDEPATGRQRAGRDTSTHYRRRDSDALEQPRSSILCRSLSEQRARDMRIIGLVITFEYYLLLTFAVVMDNLVLSIPWFVVQTGMLMNRFICFFINNGVMKIHKLSRWQIAQGAFAVFNWMQVFCYFRTCCNTATTPVQFG